MPIHLPILTDLFQQVASRCQQTATDHPWWPCRAGCDDCCRSLAEEPRFSATEWAALRHALAALPTETQASIAARLDALAADSPTANRRVCPFLDATRGLCQVYDGRPLACRTYGYYADRGDGKHCDQVTTAVAAHNDAPIVWGNETALMARAEAALGGVRPLSDWWRDDRARPTQRG